MNKMNKYWKTLSFLVPLVLLLALLVIPAASVSAASGIGVTPSSVVFMDVLPGSSSQKVLQISNLNDDTREVLAKITGDSASWISFLPGDTISIAGKGTGLLTVVVNPPQGTGPGVYDDELLLMIKPTTQVISGGAGAEITPGAMLPVRITIGGEAKVALNLISGEVSFAEVGQPLGITLILENSGNVAVTADAKVEILEEKQQSVIKTFENALDEITPAVRATVLLSVPSEGLMPETTYWAKITVILYGSVVGETMSSFHIHDPVIHSVGIGEAELLAIQVPAFAILDEPITATAVVKNTGKTVIDAQFRGSVGANNIIFWTFASPITTILPGAMANLVITASPGAEGDFTITGMVFYGEKDGQLYYFTQNKTALVSVSAPDVTATPSAPTATPIPIATSAPATPSAESGGSSGNGWILIVGLIAGGVVLVLALALLWRRQRKNASKKKA